MKTTFKGVLVVVLLFVTVVLCVPPVEASVSVNILDTSFDLQVTEVVKIKGTNKTKFTFEPNNIINSKNIALWKVLVSCENSIFISINNESQNSCGSSLKLKNSDNNKFVIILSNPTQETAIFSLRLKAYSEDDKWLHTARKAFRWK